ncbi:MAG: nucleotide exchange factor GrpE [Planctomycetes bacterium]|nr:nucleotide exchange factor GrpE [Planctomycetota bacterium]
MSDSKENVENEVVEEIVEEVAEEVVEDLEYFKNKFMRAQADVQNMRRRMHDETEERVRLRLESLLSDLMRVADYLEAGLSSIPQSVKDADQGEAFIAGMNAIQQALDMVFISHGVVFISPNSTDDFDPEKHEAVETVENTELDAPQLELLSRGYCMGTKILRPAKVRIVSNISQD